MKLVPSTSFFFTDASKVYTMLRNGNQSVEQPDPPKKKRKCSGKGFGRSMPATMISGWHLSAKWIAELKADHQASVIRQQPVAISEEEDLRLTVTRMKNWTTPGPDMIHAYWLKTLTSFYKRLACQMEKLVTEGDHPR